MYIFIKNIEKNLKKAFRNTPMHTATAILNTNVTVNRQQKNTCHLNDN